MLFQILVHSFYYNLADEVTAYVWIPFKSVEIYMKKKFKPQELSQFELNE